MYSIPQQQTFLEETKEILQSPDRFSSPVLATKLKDIINFADWTYYVNDNPLIAALGKAENRLILGFQAGLGINHQDNLNEIIRS